MGQAMWEDSTLKSRIHHRIELKYLAVVMLYIVVH